MRPTKAPNSVKTREWIEVEPGHYGPTSTKEREYFRKELFNFLHEHKEWSDLQVFINAEYEDRCPLCDKLWEVDYSGKVPRCAYCGESLLQGR